MQKQTFSIAKYKSTPISLLFIAVIVSEDANDNFILCEHATLHIFPSRRKPR